jgi:hypothetical protein
MLTATAINTLTLLGAMTFGAWFFSLLDGGH